MNIELRRLHDTLSILAEEFGNLGSQSAPSLGSLRKHAVAQALEGRNALVAVAGSAGRGEMAVARNLAATATAEQLPVLQILLKLWLREAPLEPAHEHRSLLDALPSGSKGHATLRWLLSVGKAPTLAAVIEFCDGWCPLILALEREILGVSADTDASRTLRLLKAISRRDSEFFESADHQDFAGEGFGKGLPPLDKKAFEKLPEKGRRWTLAERDFSRIALTPDLYDAIWSNPRAHPDTPETIEHKDWLEYDLPEACSDLSRRSFDTSDVTQLLRRNDLEQYTSQILNALSRNSAWNNTPTTLSLRRPLSSIENPRLRHALGFFAKRTERRLAVTAPLNEDEIRQLAQDVSETDWVLAVRKSCSKTALQRVANVVLSDSSQRTQLFKDLPESRTSSQCLDIFTRPYLDAADYSMVYRLFTMVPWQIECLTIRHLTLPLIREYLERQCIKTQNFQDLAAFARGSVLRALFSAKDPWMAEWRDQIATMALQSRNKESRIPFLELALQHAPTLITIHLDWKISQEDYELLQNNFLTGAPAYWHKHIFRFINPDGTPWWEISFRAGKRGKAIKRLIAWQRPGLSKRLSELETERLLADDTFKEKLRGVLTGEIRSRALRANRHQLRHFIPWAREEWSDKPTLAVACELALAFSLSDVRYLVALCTQRWKSGPKEREGKVFDHLYQTHTLPKKSGGKRTVTVPDDRLKRLQRKLLRGGFDELFIHPSAHGFKRGRSILSNAAVHVGQTVVVNVDIKSFFPNTRHEHILKACSYLMDGELSEGARHIIADICSYGGGLPTGAPTSPAIANLVLRAADTAIAKVAKANGINYSRYADDLTFSGDSNALRILPFVKKVLTQLGYELDPKKTNIFRRGRRQIVTGLVVNEKPNLPRRVRRRLRAAVHRESHGDTSHWHGKPMSRNELVGRLAMLHLVQPEEAKTLKRKLAGHPAP